MTRFDDKANAVVAAWKQRYAGVLPSKHAVVMCCAVAEHETNCGDAWNHSGNWGAIQRRLMIDAEKAAVKQGRLPTPSDSFEQLHGDSSPINGRYQTWFWAFPANTPYAPAGLAGDEAGAWKLLEVLLDKRPSIKAIIDSIDVQTLASNMYHTHYYEGIHDPRQPGGVEKNIDDYGHALSFTAGRFTSGLTDWQPGGAVSTLGNTDPRSSGVPGLSSVLGIQRTLNLLKVVDPLLKEDGVNGPKTRDAIQLFQREHAPLQVDGIVGSETRAQLELALKALGATAVTAPQ